MCKRYLVLILLLASAALPCSAALSAVGWIPVQFRELYHNEQNAEVQYKVTNNGLEQIRSMQIFVPSGFTLVSFSTITVAGPTGPLNKRWSASYAPGVVTLSADTYTDVISTREYVSASIFVATRDAVQQATKWDCVVTGTSTPNVPALEAAAGDMKVSIVILSMQGEAAGPSLLPGSTTTVTALLLNDYGEPLVDRTVAFSIVQGSGQIQSANPCQTDTQGKASITYRASGATGTDRLLLSYNGKTNCYVTISVVDETPSLRIDALAFYKDGVYHVKEQTPVSFTAGRAWGIQYRIDQDPWRDYAAPFNFQGRSQGAHTISYRYQDANGSVSSVVTAAVYLARMEEDRGKLYNYPNPFSPGLEDTTFEYYLNVESGVTLRVYDLFGNLVRTWEIPSGEKGARMNDWNQIVWDGRNEKDVTIASGGYIAVLTFDNNGRTFRRKIAVVK